jgi:hypothetical protein
MHREPIFEALIGDREVKSLNGAAGIVKQRPDPNGTAKFVSRADGVRRDIGGVAESNCRCPLQRSVRAGVESQWNSMQLLVTVEFG